MAEEFANAFASSTASGKAVRPAVDLGKLDKWCERGIVGLVLAILVYSPLAFGAVRLQEFVVVQWLMTAILALWLCRFWLNPKHRLLWPPVCWAVLAFMGYAVIRYLTADIEYVARQETIKVLVYGFLFLVILHNLFHLETIQTTGMVLLGVGMLIAMYGMGQFLTESDRVWGAVRPLLYHKRGSGTFICPNHFAGYLEMLLPLGLAYTLTSRLSHLTKILLAYATLAVFAGIVVSISMGGWIATGLTLVVFFIWLMRWRDYRLQGALIAGSLVVIATAFLLMAELSPNRLNHLGSMLKADDIRMRLWQPTIKMWQDAFWFGVGPGHYDPRFPQYRPDDKYAWEMQISPEWAHNDYLNTLVDWGLVGGLLVLAAWGLFYWGVFRSWKFVQRAQNDLAAKRSNKASFVMGGALGLLAILIHSLVDFNMHIPSNALLTVALMALVSAHLRYATEKYWQTVRLPLRLVISVLLLGAIVYLGGQSWRATRESYFLAKAKKLPVTSSERVRALEAAFGVESKNPDTALEIGEAYREQSWVGDENYKALAEKALPWYERSMALNAYSPFGPLRYGMCLDWLRRHSEADPYFEKALKLDPNGYLTLAYVGWHHTQRKDWAKSKQYLEKSLALRYARNPVALSYLEIVKRRMAEQGTPN